MNLEQHRRGFNDGAVLCSVFPCRDQHAWEAVKRLADAYHEANLAYLFGLEAAADYRGALRENPDSASR